MAATSLIKAISYGSKCTCKCTSVIQPPLILQCWSEGDPIIEARLYCMYLTSLEVGIIYGTCVISPHREDRCMHFVEEVQLTFILY